MPFSYSQGGITINTTNVASGVTGQVLTVNTNGTLGLMSLDEPNQHRLSLTTNVPVTIADVTAATTIYMTPYKGERVEYFNGTVWISSNSVELSLALDSNAAHAGYQQSGNVFDIFLANNSGLIIGTGPAWTSTTARGTGAGTTELTTVDGRLVNANSITLRFGSGAGDTVVIAANQATYLGSMYATANGQTEDSFLNRYLFNYINRVPRPMRRLETTSFWTYTGVLRQANGSTANQLNFIAGINDRPVTARVHVCDYGTLGVSNTNGIGLDSTSAHATGSLHSVHDQDGLIRGDDALYDGYPGLGIHFLAWLELGGAGAGFGGTLLGSQCGIFGEIYA